MSPTRRPISLVAERAVRYLRDHEGPLDSARLAREILATRAPDEPTARRLLEIAFAGDPRLSYGNGGWRLVRLPEQEESATEPDRALIFLQGLGRVLGRPFQLNGVSVLRLRGEEVVAACGGDTTGGRSSSQLRRAVLDTLDGAVAILHDPPGGLQAFENWLRQPIAEPVSLRRLAQVRLGLPAAHELESLAARLGLVWRDLEDPLEQADTLDACLRQLRRPGESLQALRAACSEGAPPLDWSRFAFDRSFLRGIPRVPGTYRFFDRNGGLLYVGKSRDLQRRIGSYFQEGRPRSVRVQELLDRLHRIEYRHSGSDLEAMLREAEQIRRDKPRQNVQRQVHVREGRSARLESILILEQAEPPSVLRAYLIHRARLVDRVDIGPRGGGLKRIERLLDDYFFFMPEGPTPLPGPDLDVEVVVRWLAVNRDNVVAFDPTDLRSAREVTTRLRWFLDQGSPFDPDGVPVLTR